MTIIPNAPASSHGLSKGRPEKFMPKNPTTNEMGIKNALMMVRVFMTSLIRFEETDR